MKTNQAKNYAIESAKRMLDFHASLAMAIGDDQGNSDTATAMQAIKLSNSLVLPDLQVIPQRQLAPAIHAANRQYGPDLPPPVIRETFTPISRLAKTVARLENQVATAPYSRSSIPKHGLKSGWNVEETPSALRGEIFKDDLSAASIARLARLKTLAQGSREKTLALGVCTAATTFEEFKKVPMSFSPPRFKTQKNGKTVEEKWLIQMMTRTVSFTTGNGETKAWKTTAKMKGDAVIPPSKGPDGKSFATALAEFTRRWGATKATELVKFLRFA